jgi:hypothetical protein
MIEPKDIFRKKFIFSIIALMTATFVTMYLRYEGTVYVQLFGIVTTGFLVSQAYVDAVKKKNESP